MTPEDRPFSEIFSSEKMTPLQLGECSAAVVEVWSNKRRHGKLKKYAGFLVFNVPGVSRYADADDLLDEAIVRTLDGRRKWNPKVDFDTHLKGCMDSIASQYGKEAARYMREKTPLVQQPNQENRLTMMMFDKTRSRLAGDKTAATVLNLLLESHSPAEIRVMLGIKGGVYGAARTRVLRCLRRIFGVLPKPHRRTTK